MPHDPLADIISPIIKVMYLPGTENQIKITRAIGAAELSQPTSWSQHTGRGRPRASCPPDIRTFVMALGCPLAQRRHGLPHPTWSTQNKPHSSADTCKDCAPLIAQKNPRCLGLLQSHAWTAVSHCAKTALQMQSCRPMLPKRHAQGLESWQAKRKRIMNISKSSLDLESLAFS